MTSNPNFADYVERVQQNLAVFSISDQAAKRYLQISDAISNYDPRFVAFAILFNEVQCYEAGNFKLKPNGELGLQRKYALHISSRLVEEATLESSLEDLKRLYANRDRRFKNTVNFSTIDLSFTGDLSKLGESTQESLKSIPIEIKNLDGLYQKLKMLSSTDDFTEEKKADLDRVRKILRGLLKRYEVEYVETNFGTTALIYEAWKQGKLVPLGTPEVDANKFNKLLDALFINLKGKTYTKLLEEMSNNLQLNGIQGRYSTLSNGKPLKAIGEGKEWINCVELSLVHKILYPPEKSEPVAISRYLIYYPLLIDDYWFAGVAYVYAKPSIDFSKEGVPEIFNQQKYSKIYNTIKSVGDTLKLSLREDALSKAEAQLKMGRQKQDVFLSAVKDYFVCFDVHRSGEGSRENAGTNKRKVYPIPCSSYPFGPPDRGIEIYGPEWLLDIPEKLALIPKEIEGYEVGLRKVLGLYHSLENLAQRIEAIEKEGKEKGIDEQSQKFAHQAAGLMRRIRSNPEVRSASLKTRVPLWFLHTLIETWGTSELDPMKPITEDDADFPDWRGESVPDIMRKIVDFSLDHALGRATLQQPGAGEADRRAWRRSFQLLSMDDPPNALRQQLGLLSPLCEWPDWAVSIGFISCFYHAFWQAAYHGFRAACGEYPPLPGTENSYLQVIIQGNQVEIRNAAVSTTDSQMPRDSAFFENLNQRFEGSFEVEGPIPQNGYWTTGITKVFR